MPARRGRPSLPKEDRRTTSFRVRVNAEELDLIRRAAGLRGRSPGRWAREAILREAKRITGED